MSWWCQIWRPISYPHKPWEFKASYLTWLRKPEALYRLSSPEFAHGAAEGMVISARTLHWRLGHPEKRRLIQVKNTAEDLEIIDMKDLLKNCRICIKIKKMKLQWHSAVIWASQSLEWVHMNIWESYCQESIIKDEYILTITNDCTRYEWVFSIKNKSSKMIKALFKKWKKKIECQTDKKIKKMRLDNSKKFKSLTKNYENEKNINVISFCSYRICRV